jgi:hypothetical protein
MSISAVVENDTIKLPVHVPDGTRVEVVLPAEDEAAAAERLVLFRRLQSEMGLTVEASEAWKEAVAAARR